MSSNLQQMVARCFGATDEQLALASEQDVMLAHRLQVLTRLASRLRKFAASHLNYFLTSEAAPPTGDARRTAISNALIQVGFDTQVIEQAAHQRLFGSADEQATLDKADKLARRALGKARMAGLLLGNGASAITYFQKSPYIRVIPYAPVALIGLPYTALKAQRDFLAIPHEVGHYVYWNGKFAENGGAVSVRGRLWKDLPSWLKTHPVAKWVEEIFADVFGARVAGAAGALSLQDRLLGYPDALFISSEAISDHPTPLLRPRIYSRVLAARNQDEWKDQATAEQLDKRWGDLVKNRFPQEAAPGVKLAVGVQPVQDLISMGAALDPDLPVDRVIRRILDLPYFDALDPDTEWAASIVNTDMLQPQLLDDRIEQCLQTVQDGAKPEIGDAADPWSDWVQSEKFDLATDWEAIASARGWSEGPDSRPPTT